jgi:hypothetical protein
MMIRHIHLPISRIVIGVDLSFNSTGITIAKWSGNRAVSMSFHRVVFETVPQPIKNVNQVTYRMPTNVDVRDLVQSNGDDFYTEDQAHITLKAMVCVKKIMKAITDSVMAHVSTLTVSGSDAKTVQSPEVHINIEGFVMPSMLGNQQLRVLGGLIMLQGMLRSELIRLKISLGRATIFKITITSPSELKLFFGGKGDADKSEMLDAFIGVFGGASLLPDTSSLSRVNDVVDSFALMLNCHWRMHTEQQRRVTKSQKKHEERQAKAKEKNKKQPILYI